MTLIADGKFDLIACCHVSNVFGIIQPVELIAEAARAAGSKLLIDGAQGVPQRFAQIVLVITLYWQDSEVRRLEHAQHEVSIIEPNPRVLEKFKCNRKYLLLH